jgi:primosomal protein N' (replication factor Y)
VEEHLNRRFRDKRISRVDSDTMRHHRLYQKLIDDFEAGRIDVLAGTQMVAKGLDFPNVSFVGVIGGDAAGAAADFRAGERLFQLMTQVAGRAGRDRVPGQVVVQTTNPEAPALRAAIRHDYHAFVVQEIETRRRWCYPPFSRLARLLLSHPREQQVRDEADALAGRLRDVISALNLPGTDLLGPRPCLLTRIRGLYRYDLILRSQRPDDLQQLLDLLRAERLFKARVKSLIVDVDPVSLT